MAQLQRSVALFVAQRGERAHAGRATGGDERGHHADNADERDDGRELQRVHARGMKIDVHHPGRGVRCRAQAKDDHDREHEPDAGSGAEHDRHVARDVAHDVAAPRAKRHADPDLPLAPRDGERDYRVEPHASQNEPECPERAERQRHGVRPLLRLLDSLLHRHGGEDRQ